MGSSLIGWVWLIIFAVVAYYVYQHWIEPNLPGA
jgi:hypothetical protein